MASHWDHFCLHCSAALYVFDWCYKKYCLCHKHHQPLSTNGDGDLGRPNHLYQLLASGADCKKNGDTERNSQIPDIRDPMAKVGGL